MHKWNFKLLALVQKCLVIGEWNTRRLPFMLCGIIKLNRAHLTHSGSEEQRTLLLH